MIIIPNTICGTSVDCILSPI